MSLVTDRARWLGRLARYLKEASADSGASIGMMLRDLLYLSATRPLGVRAYFQYRLFDPALTLQQKT